MIGTEIQVQDQDDTSLKYAFKRSSFRAFKKFYVIIFRPLLLEFEKKSTDLTASESLY